MPIAASLPAIQRRTGFEIRTIKDAIEVLKHLNPRPGSQFAASNIPYVVPDILVERAEDGTYNVRLLETDAVTDETIKTHEIRS